MNGLRVILAGADPAALPAPVWLLQFLLLFTFVLHVLFMNVVLGGALVWLWANGKARRQSDYQGVARVLGRILPVATAFAITAGVAPLLFTQLLYGQLFYTSSALMAWPWFAIVLLLLGGYYANYGISYARPATGRALSLGLVSAALFIAIGFLFTNNMTLMLRPELHAPLYFASDAGLHANLSDAWVWPRFGHMLVGAVALTGLLLAWASRVRRDLERDVAAGIERLGERLFMGATLVEFGVGVAYFFLLPAQVREVFLGGLTPDLLVLIVGAAFALAAVAVVRRSLLVGSASIVVAIADMVVVRHRVRSIMLEPYFQPESLPVAFQSVVFLMFAVLLVAGLGVVGWMIWKFVAAKTVPADKHPVAV